MKGPTWQAIWESCGCLWPGSEDNLARLEAGKYSVPAEPSNPRDVGMYDPMFAEVRRDDVIALERKATLCGLVFLTSKEGGPRIKGPVLLSHHQDVNG